MYIGQKQYFFGFLYYYINYIKKIIIKIYTIPNRYIFVTYTVEYIIFIVKGLQLNIIKIYQCICHLLYINYYTFVLHLSV